VSASTRLKAFWEEMQQRCGRGQQRHGEVGTQQEQQRQASFRKEDVPEHEAGRKKSEEMREIASPAAEGEGEGEEGVEEEVDEKEGKRLEREELGCESAQEIEKKKKKEENEKSLGCQSGISGGSGTGSHEAMKRRFKCTVEGCGASFPKAFKLDRHMRTHDKKRPFLCLWPGCEQAFRRQDHLKRHSVMHTGAKNYKCTYQGCLQAFSTSQRLKRHLGSHENPYPFACDQQGCDARFLKKSQLRKHLCEDHVGILAYACKQTGWYSTEKESAICKPLRL